MSRFSSADQVFSYVESFTNLERGGFIPREYRLERMQRLLDDFGNPHQSSPVIHVAGSKGKGSVCAFAASCCAAAGATVGLYMSPHVSDYRERISIIGGDSAAQDRNNKDRDDQVVAMGNRLAEYVDRLSESESQETLPTTFELLTLLAFLVFEQCKCEMSVIEVGLGGRLDATNLVTPAVTVITRVELEHTDYLGESLAEVAREKGGIIKPGVPLILAEQEVESGEVLRGIAAERLAPVISVSEQVEIVTGPSGDRGTEVTLSFADGITLGTRLQLLGRVQAYNAAVAALAARAAMPPMEVEAISAGLAKAWLPGRAELWPGDPRFLLDGAHTPVSIRNVLEVVGDLEPDSRRRVLVFGSVEGKQHDAMLELLVGEFGEIIIARPGTFKKSDTTELTSICRDLGGNCRLIDEMEPALAAARSALDNPGEGLVVVTGSFHLVGEARRVLMTER